jgi:hypothetical protein
MSSAVAVHSVDNMLLMLPCRDHSWAVTAPYPVFWLVNWILKAADYVTSLKPGTLRAGELARAFVQSQVRHA